MEKIQSRMSNFMGIWKIRRLKMSVNSAQEKSLHKILWMKDNLKIWTPLKWITGWCKITGYCVYQVNWIVFIKLTGSENIFSKCKLCEWTYIIPQFEWCSNLLWKFQVKLPSRKFFSSVVVINPSMKISS